MRKFILSAALLAALPAASFAIIAAPPDPDPATIDITTSPTLSSTTIPDTGAGYLIVYADLSDQTTDPPMYYEFNVPLNDQYKIIFADVTPGPGPNVTLSDAGYFISPTEIPLSDLNLTDEPPPGSQGSSFIPLPSLDGVNIPPGANIDAIVPTTPLPASVTMGLAGIVMLGGMMLGMRRGWISL